MLFNSIAFVLLVVQKGKLTAWESMTPITAARSSMMYFMVMDLADVGLTVCCD